MFCLAIKIVSPPSCIVGAYLSRVGENDPKNDDRLSLSLSISYPSLSRSRWKSDRRRSNIRGRRVFKAGVVNEVGERRKERGNWEKGGEKKDDSAPVSWTMMQVGIDDRISCGEV